MSLLLVMSLPFFFLQKNSFLAIQMILQIELDFNLAYRITQLTLSKLLILSKNLDPQFAESDLYLNYLSAVYPSHVKPSSAIVYFFLIYYYLLSVIYLVFFAVLSTYIPAGYVGEGSGGGSWGYSPFCLFGLISILRFIFLPKKITKVYPISCFIIACFLALLSREISSILVPLGIFVRIFYFLIFSYLWYIGYFQRIASKLLLTHGLKNTVTLISLFISLIFFFLSVFCSGLLAFWIPFYSNGLDPHVWGPNIALTSMFLLLSLIASLKYESLSIRLCAVMFISFVLTFISSSREVFLCLSQCQW